MAMTADPHIQWPAREADLSPPVKAWLAAQGYAVYVEEGDCDLVGLRDDEVVAVELKQGHHAHLLEQAIERAAWADFVWVATPLKPPPPRRSARYTYHGIGVLLVRESGVRVVAKARRQPFVWNKRHAYRVESLRRYPPPPDWMQGGVGTRYRDTFYAGRRDDR